MKVYKPYPGKGVLYGIVMMLVFLGIMAVPLVMISKSANNIAAAIPIGILAIVLVGVISYFIYIAASIKYILDDKQLIIRYGFSEKRISLANISNVEKRIGISLFKTAGASWPGFHFGAFSMGQNHNVTLFATHIMGDVIFIKNNWETIGITPEQPDQFLQDLQALIPNIEQKSIDPQHEIQAKTEEIKKNSKLFSIFGLINIALIAATFLWIKVKIPTLPTRIPMHIGLNGVDRYGSPSDLYMMPTISLIILVMLFLVARFYRANKLALYMLMPASILITVVLNLSIFSLLALK